MFFTPIYKFFCTAKIYIRNYFTKKQKEQPFECTLSVNRVYGMTENVDRKYDYNKFH